MFPLHQFASTSGPIGGWERAKLSFPVAGIRRPIGCRLPDAILRGQRSFGLVAGPFSGLRALKLSSEASQPASVDGCATKRRTKPRCACEGAASWLSNAGTATAFGGALARCHGSSLLPLRLPLLTSQRCFFSNIASVGEGIRTGRRPADFPGWESLFCSPQGRFCAAPEGTARAFHSVLVHSSNRVPLR